MNKISKYVVLILFILLTTTMLSASDYFRIKNRWTGQYMHIEDRKGYVQLDKKGPLSGWWSAQWYLEDLGNECFRLRNRWTNQYMHIQNKKGYVQLDEKGPLTGWWSAQWKKEALNNGYFRLKNRWTNQYMHIQNKKGYVQLDEKGPLNGWWSAQWKFEKPQRATLYEEPKIGKYALDFCREWAKNCGKPAADAFCKSKKHSSAMDFKTKYNNPPTRVINGNQVCDHAGCDRIISVTCID